MAIIIILLTLLTIITLLLHWRKPTATNLPPHPRGLPVLGNLLQAGSLPHQSFYSLSKKYGPLFLLHLGGGAPTIVVSSAELAEQVMKAQDLNFASRPPFSMANRLIYNSMDVGFSPYNDYQKKMKKIFINHLLSQKRVKFSRPVRKEEVALLVAELRASTPSAVNMSERLETLMNDIICRVALGRKFSEEKRFGRILDELVGLLGTFSMEDFIPWIGGWIDVLTGLDGRAKKTFTELDEFLEKVLKMHMAASSSKVSNGGEMADIVDVLLSLRDQQDTGDAKTLLQNDHIKALTLDMFAAGTDTIFSILEWTMAELMKHPTLLQKVQREIRDLVGSKGVIEEEDIKNLTYLNAVIKESLRLHPPGPLLLPRIAARDTKLQGYDIPAGARIMINAWAIARDPVYWDSPEEFYPERFINSNTNFRGQHFHYIPFGAGRRACPGMDFAIATIEYTLTNLLYIFDWEVPEEMKDEVLDMTESPGITIHKKSALVLRAKVHYAEPLA